jgi:hypothetical protein
VNKMKKMCSKPLQESEVAMLRFRTPVTVWKIFHYRCEVCGNVIQMHLQEGVEGPDREKCIPSPFSISCPNGCKGFCPMTHVAWNRDIEIKPSRLARDGDYVFLYDIEAGCGMPVKIIDSEFWVAKTFWPKNNRLLQLEKEKCDIKKLEARKEQDEMMKQISSSAMDEFKKML